MDKCWLLVLTGALVACPEDRPNARDCRTEGCPAGSTCESAVCVSETTGDWSVVLELRSEGGPLITVGPRALSSLGPNHLLNAALGSPVRVVGRVLGSSGALTAARVLATRGRSLPGRVPEEHAVLAPDGEFELELAPGTWELVAIPLGGGSTPPLRTPLDLSDRDFREVSVVLAPPELVMVEGTVTRSNGEPLEGVRIVAIDPETRLAISNAVTTGADEGEEVQAKFQLNLAQSAPSFLVHMSGSPTSGALEALPSLDFGPFDLEHLGYDSDRDVWLIPDAELRLAELGTPIVLSGTVEGPGNGTDRVAVGGAFLRFSTSDFGEPGAPLSNGSSEILSSSDRTGAFQALLYQGTWNIEIVPTPESGLAVTETVQYVNSTGPEPFQRGVVLLAQTLSSVSGRVFDPWGRPASGSFVRLQAGGELSDLGRAEEEPLLRSTELRTSTDGTFLAYADPGWAELRIEPEPGLALPPMFFTSRRIEPGESTLADIVLEPGVWLNGTVFGTDGQPTADVEVIVWGVRADGSSVRCGVTRTGANGRWRLLVPTTLDHEY